MIQDIAPHIYHNHYVHIRPEETDHVLIYRNKCVLLRTEPDASRSAPVFADLTENDKALCLEKAIYLFEIDGEKYFLVSNVDAQEGEHLFWFEIAHTRELQPGYVAFFVITGAQLNRWYESRAYCGRCGTPTEHSTTERAMVCPKCGTTEYPKICPAVIVCIRNGDKCVASRFVDSRGNSRYSLIAGFNEIGETLEETVHREVMEEVGLKVKNLTYYKSQPWSFSDTLLSGFYCELDGDDTLHIDHNELKEAFWISRAELPCRENDISLTAEMMENFRKGLY